jgi:hypothetical protein
MTTLEQAARLARDAMVAVQTKWDWSVDIEVDGKIEAAIEALDAAIPQQAEPVVKRSQEQAEREAIIEAAWKSKTQEEQQAEPVVVPKGAAVGDAE